MNLNFAKVQSVFPLDPISTRVLCLHCHQITNARTCKICDRGGLPDHLDANPSKQQIKIIVADRLNSAVPTPPAPRVLRIPTVLTARQKPSQEEQRWVTRHLIASLVGPDTPPLRLCPSASRHKSIFTPHPLTHHHHHHQPPIRLAFSFSFALPLMRIPWLILKKWHFHICGWWMLKKERKDKKKKERTQQSIMEYSAFSD